MQSIYSRNYFLRSNKRRLTSDCSRSANIPFNEGERLKVLARYRSSGDLLDVGCGPGDFLVLARQTGYRTSGVEISPAASRYAREKRGLTIYDTDLRAAALPSGRYDIITMWDVIEHLPDPFSDLAEVFRLLRPGGILLLSTGDSGSKWARVTGQYWQLLTPLQHLFFFNRKSLQLALLYQGLTVREMTAAVKEVSLRLILLKARESLGVVIDPLRLMAGFSGLENIRLRLKLGDLLTCVAEKPVRPEKQD